MLRAALRSDLPLNGEDKFRLKFSRADLNLMI